MRKRVSGRKDKKAFHRTATATKQVNNITPRGGKRF